MLTKTELKYFIHNPTHPSLLTDMLNVFAVYYDVRTGIFCESYCDDPHIKKLIKKLGLVRNGHLRASKNHNRQDAIITKEKLPNKYIKDEDVGRILGFYCIHKDWGNMYKERITVRITIKGINGYDFGDASKHINQLVTFLCVSKQITKRNVKELTDYVDNLKKGFTMVLQELGLDRVMKIVANYDVGVTLKKDESASIGVKLSKARLLRWKLDGEPVIDEYWGYTFK